MTPYQVIIVSELHGSNTWQIESSQTILYTKRLGGVQQENINMKREWELPVVLIRLNTFVYSVSRLELQTLYAIVPK